jgi:hypothetical protein
MLSLVFRGSTFADLRIGRLRNLAWIWITLNLILAIAVYTRLFIYIDYNGMTRMRTVGLLGVTAVVGGFALMRFKILWQRQLWILGLAMFAYVALPVDLLCHRYNVARIVAGDHAPTVQLAIHPIDNEALPVLLPLLDCDQQEIQQGVEAILLSRLAQLRQDASSDWSASQYSNTATVDALTKRLGADETNVPAGILAKREAHEYRFRTFAMEWF